MTRNFSNSLLFEQALDTIGTGNSLLFETASNLFSPSVKVIEENCGTMLGKPIYNSFRAVGLIETATGLPLTEARLQTLVGLGQAYVDTRSLDTCISKGGICRTCLRSSRPELTTTGNTVPAVGFSYKVRPQIVLDNSRLVALANAGELDLPYPASSFDRLYVYSNGTLLSEAQYSVFGSKLFLQVRTAVDTVIIVKYIVRSNIQYYYWIADTFSGSLLGVRSVQKLGLPLRKLLLESYINKYNIESLTDRLTTSTLVGEEDFVKYIPQIKDPLEQAIFVVLLNSIFVNN